jgi:hypothetical protein
MEYCVDLYGSLLFVASLGWFVAVATPLDGRRDCSGSLWSALDIAVQSHRRTRISAAQCDIRSNDFALDCLALQLLSATNLPHVAPASLDGGRFDCDHVQARLHASTGGGRRGCSLFGAFLFRVYGPLFIAGKYGGRRHGDCRQQFKRPAAVPRVLGVWDT